MTIDPRLQQMSYSSSLTLHACPRKYQLYKLRTESNSDQDSSGNVIFAFGHAVGEGTQLVLEGKSEEEILFTLFTKWYVDLLALDVKSSRSFFHAIFAIKKFIALRADGLLGGYELVYYQDKPACELSFCITTPDGFRFRGFVDAVLKHSITGEVVVLEVKTTGSRNINGAMYKNSSQALGYSVVLDVLFPKLSSYKVIYLPYQTSSMEYSVLPFSKSYLQRAAWIQSLILDIEHIKMYENTGIYPMYGESCYSFFKECEYFGICELNTTSLIKPLEQKYLDEIAAEEFTINLTLADLITSQMEKIS